MDRDFHRLIGKNREEIVLRYDSATQAIWSYTKPSVRPSYTLALINEYRNFQKELIEYFNHSNNQPKTPIKYLVNASQTPQIFNYGGDLNLFSELIDKKDKDKLFDYAKTCIDVVYDNYVNLNLPIITISLVEGDALGGGLEGAISSNICIVEEHVQLGLPEIRFNLIPGMGAYTFLSRSVGIRKAEEIISSGRLYSAKELYEIGAITEVVDSGSGKKAADQFMKKNNRLFNGMQALISARQRHSPLDYSELIDITKIWVDAALRLEPKDIKMMQKLVDAQNKKIEDMQFMLRTKQDRRFEKEPDKFPIYDSEGNIIEADRRKLKDKRSNK